MRAEAGRASNRRPNDASMGPVAPSIMSEHGSSILVVALVAGIVGLLGAAARGRDPLHRSVVLPWSLVVSALLLAAVEVVAGPGPVHGAPGLPPAAWGSLEGVALGAVFTVLGALAVRWPFVARGAPPPPRPAPRSGSGPVRAVAGVLVALAVVQLSLGIGQRAERGLLLGHAILGLAILLPLAVRLGIAAMLVAPTRPLTRRLGLAVAALVGLQAVLGVGLLLPRAALLTGAWTKTAHYGVGVAVVGLVAALFGAARPARSTDPPPRT